MGLASTNSKGYVTVESATQSDHLEIPSHIYGGRYTLQAKSDGAFVLDIQMGDGTDFDDMYYDATTKVTLDSTGNTSVSVPGGRCYRMDVDTYNNPITLTYSRD